MTYRAPVVWGIQWLAFDLGEARLKEAYTVSLGPLSRPTKRKVESMKGHGLAITYAPDGVWDGARCLAPNLAGFQSDIAEHYLRLG